MGAVRVVEQAERLSVPLGPAYQLAVRVALYELAPEEALPMIERLTR